MGWASETAFPICLVTPALLVLSYALRSQERPMPRGGRRPSDTLHETAAALTLKDGGRAGHWAQDVIRQRWGWAGREAVLILQGRGLHFLAFHFPRTEARLALTQRMKAERSMDEPSLNSTRFTRDSEEFGAKQQGGGGFLETLRGRRGCFFSQEGSDS